jgi:hypothetical protein
LSAPPSLVTASTCAPGRGPPGPGDGRERRQRGPLLLTLLEARGQPRGRVRGTVRRQRHGIDGGCAAAGRARNGRASLGRINRQDALEWRIGERRPFKGPCAEDQQAAAAHRDEVRRHLELVAGEEAAFDVAEEHRIVFEELRPSGRIARRQRVGAARHRLDVERVAPFLVLPLAHDRVDFDPVVAAERPLHEGVLEPGGAFDEQHPPAPALWWNQHAPRVVLDHGLSAVGGDRHRVHRLAIRRRRHREHLMHRGTIGRGCDAPRVQRPAVLTQPQLDRRRAKPGARQRHAQVHGRVRQQRLAGGEVHDLTIAKRRAADTDSKHWNANGPPAPGFFRRGIPTVRDHDDAREPPAAVSVGQCLQSGAEVAAAGVGSQLPGLGPGQRLAKGQQLGLKILAQLSLQVAGDLARAIDSCARAVDEAHAPRHVDKDRHDAVTNAASLDELDRPQQEHHDERQRQGAQRRQDDPLRARHRDGDARVCQPCEGQCGRKGQAVAPPGEGNRELNHRLHRLHRFKWSDSVFVGGAIAYSWRDSVFVARAPLPGC